MEAHILGRVGGMGNGLVADTGLVVGTVVDSGIPDCTDLAEDNLGCVNRTATGIDCKGLTLLGDAMVRFELIDINKVEMYCNGDSSCSKRFIR